MNEFLQVFQGANPAMICIVVLMGLFGAMLCVCLVGGFIQWLLNIKGMQCGWGCWYNQNRGDHGYCKRRAYHLGEHNGWNTWRVKEQREWQKKQRAGAR